MGLQHAGYKVINTKFDGNLVITLWESINTDKEKDPVVFIKLVHDKERPIYMDYENADHGIIRKVYYYDYISLNGIDFPKTFTEILYQGKDSVVSKTEYSDIKINNLANSTLFEFNIPENAKLTRK
ncbi:MAG TPA: hypothetical protein VFX43_14225 [Chitinophagaceae bacterium]|nr:hypothetical protein [Chitinophagaceae bacterium]